MDDTVSRQAVLNVLDEIEAQYVFDDGHDRLLQYAKNKVAALPCEYPTPLETIHCTNEQIERLRNTISLTASPDGMTLTQSVVITRIRTLWHGCHYQNRTGKKVRSDGKDT